MHKHRTIWPPLFITHDHHPPTHIIATIQRPATPPPSTNTITTNQHPAAPPPTYDRRSSHYRHSTPTTTHPAITILPLHHRHHHLKSPPSFLNSQLPPAHHHSPYNNHLTACHLSTFSVIANHQYSHHDDHPYPTTTCPRIHHTPQLPNSSQIYYRHQQNRPDLVEVHPTVVDKGGA
ncbi:hypothetical protein RND81_06G093200 [Saponaria officinalis]|uniref:Uncharacterized protein n=1 Tax=Saponaria officinalis TaxID=3572 RepID=A0AAW1KAY3_SAPOF